MADKPVSQRLGSKCSPGWSDQHSTLQEVTAKACHNINSDPLKKWLPNVQNSRNKILFQNKLLWTRVLANEIVKILLFAKVGDPAMLDKALGKWAETGHNGTHMWAF